MTRPPIYIVISSDDPEDPVQGVHDSWKTALKWAQDTSNEDFRIEEWTWDDQVQRYRFQP